MREKIVIDKGGRGSKGHMGSVYNWDKGKFSLIFLHKSTTIIKNLLTKKSYFDGNLASTLIIYIVLEV